jgi:hypothetical protein
MTRRKREILLRERRAISPVLAAFWFHGRDEIRLEQALEMFPSAQRGPHKRAVELAARVLFPLLLRRSARRLKRVARRG